MPLIIDNSKSISCLKFAWSVHVLRRIRQQSSGLSTTDQAIFDADDIRSVIYPTHDRPLPLFAHATRGAYASRDRDYIANSRNKHFHAVSTGSKKCELRSTRNVRKVSVSRIYSAGKYRRIEDSYRFNYLLRNI